jgi:cobalt/nickel transport system permease protein
MHMSDALVSPAVGGALWAASAGLTAWSARRVERAADERRVPLMGVLGAFVFAAQMVNFSIPGTGSSGHLGGGLLLAVLLGPHAGFVVMASVLLVQALLFADGGLLAYGANVVNLGFFTAFVACPLVWRRIAGRDASPARLAIASVAASVVGLELGAAGVVLATAASGISTLPLRPFLALMLGIHLAIGLVEGLVTAAVLVVLRRARPELLGAVGPRRSLAPVLAGLAAATALAVGGLSSLASRDPDGLEWSLARAGGGEEPGPAATGVRAVLARLQERTAALPGSAAPGGAAGAASAAVGALATLGLAAAAGLGLRALARGRASRTR